MWVVYSVVVWLSSDLPKLPFNKHKGNSLKRRRYCIADAAAGTDSGYCCDKMRSQKQVGVNSIWWQRKHRHEFVEMIFRSYLHLAHTDLLWNWFLFDDLLANLLYGITCTHTHTPAGENCPVVTKPIYPQSTNKQINIHVVIIIRVDNALVILLLEISLDNDIDKCVHSHLPNVRELLFSHKHTWRVIWMEWIHSMTDEAIRMT